ncbi:DUF2884 family protein [Arsukibacterium sp.]|uniref:DUF2884 family protein n=1 Tax=Arsukibacterium sp. TaxID=1977258 RepID=UPI002FD8CAC7
MKTLLMIGSLLMAGQVNAHQQCQLQLNNDLLIEQQQVQLLSNNQPLWRINNDGQLWLDNQPVSTDADTRKLLQQYQQGVRQQAEETVYVVTEAMALAATAVEQVLTELTGKPLSKNKPMQQVLQNIQNSTDTIIVRRGEQLEIRGSQLQQLDKAFGPEFAAAIEQLVQESMGSILWQLGKAMMGGSGDFEQRMDAFGQRMEQFGEQLEQSMTAKADLLEQRGDALCQQLQQLEQLETAIQQRLPAMVQYDLVNSQLHSSQQHNM